MIRIPQPAMAMNSHDVPAPWYQMTNTMAVGATVTPKGLMGWAATVFKDFKDKYPDNRATLIINCHGYENKAGIGGYGLSIGTGIYTRAHVEEFTKIAPFVDDIIIVACKAAQHVVGQANGDEFIRKIAQKAQAKVTASTAAQRGRGDPDWMPFGHINSFEGMVLNYDAEGSIMGFRDWGNE